MVIAMIVMFFDLVMMVIVLLALAMDMLEPVAFFIYIGEHGLDLDIV